MKTKSAKTIPSIRQLAKLLKRDEKTVRGWLADDRWPFRRQPPFNIGDVERIDAWRAQTLEQQPDAEANDALAVAGIKANPERIAKLKLVIERTAKLRLERELLAGKFITREDAEADLIARATEAKTMLLAIGGLAPRLVGRTEDEIRDILTKHVEDSCNRIAGGAA